MRKAAIVSTASTGIGATCRGMFDAGGAPVPAGHVTNAAVDERAGIV